MVAFYKAFNKGKFGKKTLGQAFYDEFGLQRIVDQTKLKNLTAKDGEHAKRLIEEIFDFN